MYPTTVYRLSVLIEAFETLEAHSVPEKTEDKIILIEGAIQDMIKKEERETELNCDTTCVNQCIQSHDKPNSLKKQAMDCYVNTCKCLVKAQEDNPQFIAMDATQVFADLNDVQSPRTGIECYNCSGKHC